MHVAIEIVGWTGALLVLVAYWLVSHGRLGGTTFTFQAMNVGGALMLAANGYYHGAFPAVFVNVCWLLIGLFALWWHRRARGTTSSS